MHIFARHALVKARKRMTKRPRLPRPPVWLYPRAIEIGYKVRLRRLVRSWERLFVDELKHSLPPALTQAGKEIRGDSYADMLEEIMGRLNTTLDQSIDDFSVYSANVGQKVSKWNNKQWQKTMKSVLGVEDVFAPESFLGSRLQLFVSNNVNLITSMKNDSLKSVRRIVESGARDGDRYETIMDDLMEQGLVKTEAKAELIARDQVGKLNGDLTKYRQQSLGVQYYTWHTAEDDRVRDSHQALDGMLCDWEDPTVYSDDGGETWKPRSDIDAFEGHPGEDFQCRCFAEADLNTVVEDIDNESD